MIVSASTASISDSLVARDTRILFGTLKIASKSPPIIFFNDKNLDFALHWATEAVCKDVVVVFSFHPPFTRPTSFYSGLTCVGIPKPKNSNMSYFLQQHTPTIRNPYGVFRVAITVCPSKARKEVVRIEGQFLGAEIEIQEVGLGS